jgi:hypothetical protein
MHTPVSWQCGILDLPHPAAWIPENISIAPQHDGAIEASGAAVGIIRSGIMQHQAQGGRRIVGAEHSP